MEPLRIVFMGTPEFAAGILDAILDKGYNVVGVVTAPDKPAGRGQKIRYSAVKEYALAKGLRLLQPVKLKDPEFLTQLQALNANVQVVVAFRMLPEAVWKMPKLGTFNLHASLLPQYRGAAPINWAIINGEENTGVTTFFIDEKIDTGAMILSAETPIDPNENAGSLHDRLLEMGRGVVTDTLSLIEKDQATPTVQPHSADLKDAPKLLRDNTRIDWNKPANVVHNLIRGLSPYPAAWTVFKDNGQEWTVKIYESVVHPDCKMDSGKLAADRRKLFIGTAKGAVEILSLQFPGKKRMSAAELLNGMGFSDNASAE